METITSLCSNVIVQLKYNVEDLKNPKADQIKKKKSIKVIKGSEDELTDNKEFRKVLNKLTSSIMDMKLSTDEEIFAFGWRCHFKKTFEDKFEEYFTTSMTEVAKVEETFVSNDPVGKDPGDKNSPDLVPKTLELGEAPDQLYKWNQDYNKWIAHCFPSRKNDLHWNRERIGLKLEHSG